MHGLGVQGDTNAIFVQPKLSGEILPWYRTLEMGGLGETETGTRFVEIIGVFISAAGDPGTRAGDAFGFGAAGENTWIAGISSSVCVSVFFIIGLFLVMVVFLIIQIRRVMMINSMEMITISEFVRGPESPWGPSPRYGPPWDLAPQ